MLTSYVVKCPHFGCVWYGSLIPENTGSTWHATPANTTIVSFRCPECECEWHARLVGEDIEAVPQEALAGA